MFLWGKKLEQIHIKKNVSIWGKICDKFSIKFFHPLIFFNDKITFKKLFPHWG